jgi:hypothetical protein
MLKTERGINHYVLVYIGSVMSIAQEEKFIQHDGWFFPGTKSKELYKSRSVSWSSFIRRRSSAVRDQAEEKAS